MTTMIAELYEALIDAGASEDKAKEAAQVLSTENLATKSDIAELDTKLSGQIAKLDQRLSPKVVKLERDMAVMKWMLGTTMAGVASILAAVLSMVIKIFFLA